MIYTQIGNKNNSNSLEVIGIVIRKDVNGIGVVVWIEIVNVERKENNTVTKTTNCIELKKMNGRTTETATIKLEVHVKSVFLKTTNTYKRKGEITHNRKGNIEKK